jgi:signal transduction histidine kinase
MAFPFRCKRAQVSIHNAIKYSKKGKIYIDLLLSDRKPGAIFSIKDEGIGIESEYIDDIFLEFVRSPNARDYGLDGSGLGLVIVKEVLMNMVKKSRGIQCYQGNYF